MFKGLFLILVIGFVIVLIIVAIIASIVLRTVHRVKKAIKGELVDDDYNPEIGKKHQHYTYRVRTYGGSAHGGSSQSEGYSYSEEQANDEQIHKSSTGEELFETRNDDQVNRQIFSSEEGEYVDFTEEH